MSEPETQLEQPTEQVEEAPKPKKTWCPNKKQCKTADPIFQDYYQNKAKPNNN